MSVVVKKARPRLIGAKGSFSDALDYALREGRHTEKERPLDVFAVNVASLETAASEMDAIAAQSGVRKDPIYHVIVSWDRGEYPSSEDARQAAAIVAEQLGMERHQYVGSLQTDGKAGLYHLHIIVNRVDPVTLRSWDSIRDYPKLNGAAHAIVGEQGWSPIHYQFPTLERNEETGKREYRGGNPLTRNLARGARDASYRSITRAFQTRVRDDLAPLVKRHIAEKTLTWSRLHDALRARDARYIVTEKGARIEGRAPGEYAGGAKHLGVAHRDLIATLGPYVPDRHARRSFEDRVHSATLEARALRKQAGATWQDVHKAFESRGLRYDRFGGGARIYDQDSPAFIKAADAGAAMRFGAMRKAFGEFQTALTAEKRAAQQDVVDRAEDLVIGQRYLNDPRPIVEALTRNDSTFTVSRLYSEIGNRVRDEQQQHEIAERIASDSVILQDSNGGRRFTTSAVLEEERALVRAARSLATSFVNGGAPLRPASENLDGQQRESYRRSISDRQLVMVTGVPGSGKTHLLDEVAAAWRENGYRVRGVSVSNKAARIMNEQTSFSSRSVSKELYEWSQGRDQLTHRDVLIIDEISMLDSAQGKRLLEEAVRVSAVVRAYGDDRQFSAVGRGDAMRAMRDELERAGDTVFDMKETRRQRLDDTDRNPAWMRQATRDIREGRIRAGLDAYRERGFIEGHGDRTIAAQRLIEYWKRDTASGYDVGLAAYRRDDVVLLNTLARQVARDRGQIVGADHEMETAYGKRAFAEGDRVVVRQTLFGGVGADGLRERWSNGDEAHVARIDASMLHLVRERDGARVAVDVSRDNQIDHAYASTKHREQGSTHERQLVFVSRADDARSTLVGMTRHQEQLRIVFAGEDFRHGYESVVKLAERTRVKEMSTDYTVVRYGRELHVQERENVARRNASQQTLPERTLEMASTGDNIPESLRNELERSGLTYEQWLNRQYAASERTQAADEFAAPHQTLQDYESAQGVPRYSDGVDERRMFDPEAEVANYQREGDAMAGRLSREELSAFMREREVQREQHGLGGEANFAKAKARALREPERGERLEGTVAYMKPRGDGMTTLLITQKDKPVEYARLDIADAGARELKIGDRIRAEVDGKSWECTRAENDERIHDERVQENATEHER